MALIAHPLRGICAQVAVRERRGGEKEDGKGGGVVAMLSLYVSTEMPRILLYRKREKKREITLP